VLGLVYEPACSCICLTLPLLKPSRHRKLLKMFPLCAAVRDFSDYGSSLTDASPDFENCFQPAMPEGRIVDTQLGDDQKPVYNPVSGM